MSTDDRFERLLAEVLDARTPSRAPDRLEPETLRALRHVRRWPRWLALIKEPPMRTSSSLAVGSPMARVAFIVVATLLLALTVAGAGIAGSRLIAADGTIVVDQGGEGTVTTITEAVAMAEDGDTILVRPGTYDESVIITKDITIRGDGDREAVVVELSVEMPPGGTFNPPHLPTAFRFESSDAVIENLTLRGISSRVVIDGGAPELRDLVFESVGKVWTNGDGSAPAGLVIDNDSTALIEDNMIVDTDIGIRLGASPTLLGNEITIGAIFMTEEAGPIIRENILADSPKWGIAVWDGARPEIVDNTIVDALNGIEVEDTGSAPTMRGNTISGSRFQGISVGPLADATIDGNVLTDNSIGIQTSSSDASMVDNTVSGGSVGISITGGSPTLEANEIDGAKRGLVIGLGTTPTLEGNTVCGNTINLEVNERAEMPDTAGNEICPDAPVE